MSTTNSNLDNDPFPVFTPKNLPQHLGRSPASSNNNSNNNNNNVNSLLQQSPFASRYNNANNNNSNNNLQLLNQNPNMMNLIRSPSNAIRQQQQQQQTQLNDQSRQMLNMVQNLNLNQQNNLQSPLMSKLQSTNAASPSQLVAAAAAAAAAAGQPTSTHRKLFANIDNNHLSNNDMALLNGVNMNSGAPMGMMAPGDADHQMRTQPADLSCIVHQKRNDSYFMSDELKAELIRKNLISQSLPSQELAIQLPVQVKDYHNLIPLDNQQINIDHKSRTFSYQTISYRATHIKTNSQYYLKRIIGFRYVSQRCMEVVEAWKKIQNANIITLRDVFGTKEFNDHSIIFVYDYFPGLDTLQYRLYNNPNINLKGWSNPYNLDGAARPYSAGKTINNSKSLGLLPEQCVWEYVIQLTSIIRTIHSANLACRIITPSRLLVDHKGRLRLSGCGIFDVIDLENSLINVSAYQQEDLIEFGRLVLALACNSLIAIQKEHINTSVDIISKNYSSDLRNLILHFMTPQANVNGRIKSINDSMPIIGARFYTSLDNVYTRGDVVENELSKELDNGRLFRLITKINILLERPESDWSETGDRYMIKLFRDYVFHQLTPNGTPWIDFAFIIQCLNKFDAGSNEKICLVSPDGQNIMIVSYSQLKKCFEKVFNELTANMNT